MPSLEDQSEINNNFSARYSRLIIRWRWSSVFLSLILVGSGLTGLSGVGFNASYRVFFGKDNPQLKAYDKFQAIYAKDDNVTVVINHPQKKVFSNEVLETIRELTDELWQTAYVTRVDSITNYQHTAVVEDDLIVDDLITHLPLSEEALRGKEKIALNEPLLAGFLLSYDGRVTQINARVLFPPLRENPNVASEIFALVEDLINRQKNEHPEIEYRISGVVATNTAFSKTPQEEMKKMMPLMLGAIILSMIFLVRSFAGVILPLLVVFLSIFFTLGMSGHLGIYLTPVSAAFPQILLAVAIAYSIHIVVSYAHQRRMGIKQNEAVKIAMEKNLAPVFLTAVTTSIGFLSMTLNEVPPVRHLGILVGLGVMFTFIISVTLLPALLSICPCGIRPSASGGPTIHGEKDRLEWTERLGNFVIQQGRVLFYSFLALTAIGTFFLFRLEFDNNPINYFKTGTWYRDTADFVDANLTGVTFTDYSLESGQPNGITDPNYLKKVEAFSDYIMTIPEVVHVNSIVPIMKRLNQNLHADDPAYYRIPENQELAAQYLLLYTLSLPFGLDLTNQINVDYSSTRVTATMKKISGKRHREILGQIDAWVLENAPFLKAEGTGSWVMFTFLSDRVIHGMIKSLLLALFLITLVCIVACRSLRLGLISLLPNGLPILLTFGVWGMLGDHVDFAVSIVASAALGIIVDDTMHLMVRYRRNREKGEDSGSSFRSALQDSGEALLFTSIILSIGFGLFMFSGFRINSSMGAMISISIILALFYDFLFLPCVLQLFDGNGVNKKVRSA